MVMALWGKHRPRSLEQLLPLRTPSVINDNEGVHTVPAVPTQAPAHFEYAEEAKRAAQRYFEQVAHIEHITTERDDWRSRALAAENEVVRLLAREAALLAQIDAKAIAGMKQADEYKTTLTLIGAQYASAAKLLLDGFAALGKAGLRMKADVPGLTEMALQAEDGPLPRVVSQGPRE